MKSLSSAAALAAALFLSAASIGANAQTGRPSEAPSVQPSVGDTYGSGPGSYARYLMLNGTPRDVALAEARNIDHPAPSRHFALHLASHTVKGGEAKPQATAQP
jgi:hypothetical protein